MIRKAKIEDKKTIINLISMMIGDEDKESTAKIVVEELYAFDCYHTFVLENESSIQGYIVLKTNPFDGGGNLGEIVFLGVDKGARKKGHGSDLVAFIENYARELNMRKLYIKTSPLNKQAVCFWINRDYQFEARMIDFSGINIDDYYLGKVIC